ncbi:MAG: BolA family protein [Deltaproteobacteria bacterium]|nr:BolA family protein [Deltaproteobacteria bacterium]
MKNTVEKIERILRERFDPLHIEIADESAAHAGHAGAASGGGHYRVKIVSARFEGMPPLAQHRLVNEALADLLQGEIHALALTTLPTSGWQK